MKQIGVTFTDQRVTLDGESFENCTFVRCTLCFEGTGETSLISNTLVDCEFALEGAAQRTMRFVHGMAGSSDAFLVTLLKSLNLDAARLARIAGQAHHRRSTLS